METTDIDRLIISKDMPRGLFFFPSLFPPLRLLMMHVEMMGFVVALHHV